MVSQSSFKRDVSSESAPHHTHMDPVFVMEFLQCPSGVSQDLLDCRDGEVWMLSQQAKKGISETLVD